MNTNIIQLINNSGYDVFFLVVDEFLNLNFDIGLTNFYPVYRPELKIKNSGQLLSHPQVAEYIQKTSSSNRHKIAILPFKPSAKIDHLCQQNNQLCLSNPATLNRFLEDKIKFVDICRQFNIPIPPSKVTSLTHAEFSQCQAQWGSQLIVQTHFGWAGNSTFSANTWDEIRGKIEPGTTVKYSPFISGYSLLNNCCQTYLGLIQSPPALQFTGLPEFTYNPFSTVGRQWPLKAPEKVIQQVGDITTKFGTVLKKLNYRGFFGLDFIVDKNDQVFLLECNPRLTASFAFYTKIEIKNNTTPLFHLHLAEFLNLKYSLSLQEEQLRFNNTNIIGTQLTPRLNSQNRITKVIEKF